MTEFEQSVYLALALFVAGSLISVFSPDLRIILIDAFARFAAPYRRRRNRKISRRIVLLEEPSSSVRVEIAYFFNHLFMALGVLATVLFFAILLILRVEPLISAIGFVLSWSWFVIIINGPFDAALQLKHPQKSITKLRERLSSH